MALMLWRAAAIAVVAAGLTAPAWAQDTGDAWGLSPATQSWLMGLGAPGALMLGAFALGRLAQVVSTRLEKGIVIRHEHAIAPETRSFVVEVLLPQIDEMRKDSPPRRRSVG